MAVRLILGLHNHQPVGNFDSVFAQTHADAYRPFLDLIAEFPQLPFVLHTSGSLLEWLEAHRPEYLRDLKALVEKGQVEILGGAYYEPILTMLPRRDRLGQIQRFSAHLLEVFGVKVRGMWIAERVWEPGLVGDLADAGIEYTLLDDFHFRQAGVAADQLFQPFVTEDEGRLLRVFPISEPLRYLVPWKTPAEAVRYLVELNDAHPNAVVVCADDGEKFGGWPSTHEHCFTKGWLKGFFERLSDAVEGGAVRAQTLAQTADQTPAAPLIYLPDCSYREMTEWALPVARQVEYQQCVQAADALQPPNGPLLKSFLRGGSWRNFRVKYPEVREMYARMLEVSEQVNSARAQGRANVNAAELELYRAQCNCAYWHGAFGGLYLPHLRHAVYEHLIAAENLLLPPELLAGERVEVECRDFNLDGAPEVRLANDKLAVYLAPAAGGTLYELDVRPIRRNIQASLARREESYHEVVRRTAEGMQAKSTVSLVQEQTPFKQAGLENLLARDAGPRHSLIDHFFPETSTLGDLREGKLHELGDFQGQAFRHEILKPSSAAQIVLRRAGKVAGHPAVLTKSLALAPGEDRLAVSYRVDAAALPAGTCFGVELLIAGMAARQPDRYFVLPERPNAGPLESILDLPSTSQVAIIDEWLKLRISLTWDRPAALWAWPQQTVSQSEGGFEAVHQGNLLLPHWKLLPNKDEFWEVNIEWRFERLGG